MSDTKDTRSIVEVPDDRPESPHAVLMTYETVIPCREGLALLQQFREWSPTLFELAERVDFIDPKHPGFKNNPSWLAFARHYSTCENCNEA